jgi:hypothetical protein
VSCLKGYILQLRLSMEVTMKDETVTRFISEERLKSYKNFEEYKENLYFSEDKRKSKRQIIIVSYVNKASQLEKLLI